MEKVEIQYANSVKRLYFHKGRCYNNYVKHTKFKEREKESLDKLVEIIKEVHKIDMIPNNFYPDLQFLRNGNYGRKKGDTRYKKGFTYSLIGETYKYCRRDIRKWKDIKKFDGLLWELKYGLAIVKDKIMIVKKRNLKKEHRDGVQESIQKKMIQNDTKIESDKKQLNYKRKDNPKDITEFLDD